MSDNQLPVNTAARVPVVAGLRPLLLLIGLAAAVAAGVGIALWSQGESYEMVYGNLSDADAAKMVAALDQAGIPRKFQNGAVMVPAERLTDARLDLANKGLPGSSDFSMLSEDPGFGVSQFMENARYQRALEGELARTISGVRGISGARVHLAVPQQSAFVRDRRSVSASVMLELGSGNRPSRETIEAIVNLVAASVPELDAANVTVADNAGHLLSSLEKDGELAEREHQMELAQRLEDDYSNRIVKLLTNVLGPNRVSAQVWAETESATTEEAREQYSPQSQVVRSEKTSEDITHEGTGPQGVPGALSNQPPQGGTALPPGVTPAANAQTAQNATAVADAGNSSRQSTRNYEIDRTVAYTKTPAGRLTRLTVAVVVDNLRTTDADGKVTETPLTEAQLASITTLVRDAVGLDEKRGDRISVVNQSFHAEAVAEGEVGKEPIWQNPLVRDLLKLVAGLIIIALLVIFVVRPLIRGLAAPTRAMLAAGPAGPQGPAGEAVMAAQVASRSGTAIAYEQQIAQVRSLVAKDPARVAQVVKDWVQKDE
jgi:flagellar M-ring protein FliF